MGNLARVYKITEPLGRAVPLGEETLRLARASLGRDHPLTLTTMGNLADAYRLAGKPELALPLGEETAARLRVGLGPDHPSTMTSLANLAAYYSEAGQNDRAAALLEETLALERAKLGPDHPNTLTTMTNLATTYRLAGRLDRALPLVEEVARLRAAKSGDDYPETWLARAALGLAYVEAGRLAEALPLLEAAYKERRRHPTLQTIAFDLLDAYLRAGRPEKAAVFARETLAERLPAAPAGSPQRASLLGTVAVGLVKAGAWDEAEPILRECLAIREKSDPNSWGIFNTRSMLGGVLLSRKQYAEAEPLLRDGYRGLKERAGAIPPKARPRLADALDRLIALGEATGKADEVKAWRAERARLDADAAPKPGAEAR